MATPLCITDFTDSVFSIIQPGNFLPPSATGVHNNTKKKHSTHKGLEAFLEHYLSNLTSGLHILFTTLLLYVIHSIPVNFNNICINRV